MTVDAIDQSWGYIDPQSAKAHGIRVVCDYLSHDPSKNWTAAQIKAYHSAGIGVVLNWESLPGRPLEGAAAGRDDATAAVEQARRLIDELGYSPRGKIGIVFSCDRDVNPSQYPAIDAYYSATKQIVTAAGFLNGAYGEADLIDHLHAAGLTVVEWQTLAWSGGRISPNADLYQSSINNTLAGASVDFDRVLHVNELGAWWPPGEQTDTSNSTPLGGLMALSSAQQEQLYRMTAYIYKQIRAGVAPGQTSFASTTQADLRVGQSNANSLSLILAELKKLNGGGK